MIPHILCKISNFRSIIAQRFSGISGLKFVGVAHNACNALSILSTLFSAGRLENDSNLVLLRQKM